MADFKIISKPIEICFECPHCENYVSLSWGRIEAPECWCDPWPDVKCPECDEIVPLGEWEYD